jgi:hypothetical protein
MLPGAGGSGVPGRGCLFCPKKHSGCLCLQGETMAPKSRGALIRALLPRTIQTGLYAQDRTVRGPIGSSMVDESCSCERPNDMPA